MYFTHRHKAVNYMLSPAEVVRWESGCVRAIVWAASVTRWGVGGCPSVLKAGRGRLFRRGIVPRVYSRQCCLGSVLCLRHLSVYLSFPCPSCYLLLSLKI